MHPVKTFHVRPPLPERLLAPSRTLAYNLRWSWNHDTISLFRRLDRDLWEPTGHNPVLMLGSITQERLDEAAAGRGLPRPPRPRGRDLRRLPGAAPAPGTGKQHRRRRPHPRSPTSRGVRPHRVPADLLRRPGHPGRRPPEVGQRPRPAAGRRRPALPAGLLPPVPERRRLAAGDATRTTTSTTCRCRSCRDARRARRVRVERATSRAARSSLPDLARAGRAASRSTCSTPTSPENPPRRPRHHRPALRRRPRDAHPPGDPAGHRRHARADGAGHRSPRVCHMNEGHSRVPRRWSASAC